MSDIVDVANKQVEAERQNILDDIQRRANDIPEGQPGICETCGEDSPRLVNEMCCPCRDRYEV